MNETVFALVTAAVVGFFTLAAVYMQNKHHASEATKRLEHDDTMARAAFEREKSAVENERLAARIAEQLAWGDRIGWAVGRTKYLYDQVSTRETTGSRRREQRTKMLGAVLAHVGIDPNAFSPLASLLEPELLEDQELGALVSEQRAILDDTYFALSVRSDYEPQVLPQSPLDFIDGLKDLKKRIELRMRALKREGRPF